MVRNAKKSIKNYLKNKLIFIYSILDYYYCYLAGLTGF